MEKLRGNTPQAQKEMLAALGLADMEALFADIPPQVRLKRALDLPAPLSEDELSRYFGSLAAQNSNLQDYPSFLGAGVYDRHIPAVIDHLVSRQEFLTAYTPYQAEISQGTLQNIFEYQTMICELTGMDAANASMYDGASALAEACATACNAARRDKVLISAALNPEYRRTVATYCRFNGIKLEEFPHQGASDWQALEKRLDDTIAGIIVAQPNFFGIVEDIAYAAELAHRHKALLIVAASPVALAVLAAPGGLGADIVVGEGQELGNPPAFGGPHLGFFSVKEKYLRRMPGRLAGQTQDKEGRRGFVLTMQTREQHIRREKATSNICSNQALCALRAAIYLACMGKEGLREVAEQSLAKAHYAYEELLADGAFSPLFPEQPFFCEFALKSEKEDVKGLNKRLFDHGIIGGLALEKVLPELKDGWLLAFTEKRSRQEIDFLIEKAGESPC